MDLHPLETRLFDSVAKAHWRRTRGSRGNRFVGPIRAAALEVAALEAAAHEAAAHEAAVHEAAAIKAVVHVKVALEAAVASKSEHSVVRYGHSMRICHMSSATGVRTIPRWSQVLWLSFKKLESAPPADV